MYNAICHKDFNNFSVNTSLLCRSNVLPSRLLSCPSDTAVFLWPIIQFLLRHGIICYTNFLHDVPLVTLNGN